MHLIRLLVTHFLISITVVKLTLYKHCKNIYTVEHTHEEFASYYLAAFATRIIRTSICSSDYITETIEAMVAFATSVISHHFLESFLIQMT